MGDTAICCRFGAFYMNSRLKSTNIFLIKLPLFSRTFACFGLWLFEQAVDMYSSPRRVKQSAHTWSHKPSSISLLLKKCFSSPFINVWHWRTFFTKCHRMQAVSQQPIGGQIFNKRLSVFSAALVYSTPTQLITEVSPAGKWTERLWEADRDERQFEKFKLCLDLICSM